MNKNQIDWQISPQSKISEYFFRNRSSMVKYALYSNVLDRIVATDAYDLWTFYDAARLLSSKIALNLCVFKFDVSNLDIQKGFVLEWSLFNKKKLTPKKQTPEVIIIDHLEDVVRVGLPESYSANKNRIDKELKFINFVIKATYALKLTDLVCGSNAELANEDQNFYISLFYEECRELQINSALDKTSWPGGFGSEIRKILYRSADIEEALTALSEMYCHVVPENLGGAVSGSRTLNMVYFYKQKYTSTFFDFLEWKPNK